MGTSGLVVMARGTEMQRALSAAFAERRVHKRYEAVVDGAMPLREDWSLIDAPLMADWPRRPLQKVDPAKASRASRGGRRCHCPAASPRPRMCCWSR
jgi:tRNA pseudouridine32 synthase/23S rRNA pseudouridine746 synthase